MRGRFALRVKIARLQPVTYGHGGEITTTERILSAIDTRSDASFGTCQDTNTIQIAIAGDKG
jgi:hypothetical protein